MINQRLLKSLILTLAIVLLPGIAAYAADSTTVSVGMEMSLNGVEIPPGTYKMTWESQGSEVTVTFARNGKVVTTARGRLVDRELKYNRSAIVCKMNPDGTRTLVEVRLGSKNKAIVFDQ